MVALSFLFVIPNLHRSPESAALLERLCLIPQEEYSVSVFLSDVQNPRKRLLFNLSDHYKKALELIPPGIKLLTSIDDNTCYDSVGVFSDDMSVRDALKMVHANTWHLFLHRQPAAISTSKELYRYFYDRFDQINAASFSIKADLLRLFPDLAAKTYIMSDDVRRHFLDRLAYRSPAWEDMYFQGIRIVSSWNLHHHKYWDLALLTARILKKRKILFRWDIVKPYPEDVDQERSCAGLLTASAGEIAETARIRLLIRMLGLKEHVFVEEDCSHCYAYIGQCDVFAAFGYESDRDPMIDAALMLDKDIAATDSSAHTLQLQWEDGTALASDDPYSYADAILHLIDEENA